MKEDIKNQMQCDEILMDIPYADEKGREALIKSLNDLLSKRFDLIVRKRELQYEQLYRRLERLQQELNKQKEEIDKLKGAKEETVNERVKVLMDRADKADWN
jgi:triphosphoribosyl-dephospho-CoA synthetase